jgi:hypothetical protein
MNTRGIRAVTLFGMKRALLATAALIAVPIAVAGCGGSGKNSSTTTTQTSAVVTWAGGVCSAATSYKTSLTDAGSTLKNAPSRSAIEKAAGSVRDATKTFITSLQDLGKPGTAAGKQATSTIGGLKFDLTKDLKAIQDAASGASRLSAVSVTSSTLLTAQTQVKSAVEDLKATDVKGELHDAFATAPSCASFG